MCDGSATMESTRRGAAWHSSVAQPGATPGPVSMRSDEKEEPVAGQPGHASEDEMLARVNSRGGGGAERGAARGAPKLVEDDAVLVERARTGDERAFAQL